MTKFYEYSNNGVHAVVTEEVMNKIKHYEEMQKEASGEGEPFQAPYPGPIFTFSDAPGLRGVVTGTLADKEDLLRGREVVLRFFYVPFSNWGGSFRALLQHMADSEADYGEAAYNELRFMTTLREVMDAFELVRPSKVRVLDDEPRPQGSRVTVRD